jgi:DNA-binding MarR family transcriptional regulator
MPQFNILRILRGAKAEINVNTVKERMVEKSPNTTRLMDKLIDKGLIVRSRCKEDRRVVYVKITENGLKLLSEIDKNDLGTSLNDIGISDEEANVLSDLLDKVRLNFE